MKAIKYFRSGVRFSERLTRNLILQIKWIFWTSRDIPKKLLSLHANPHPALPFVYSLVAVIFVFIIVVPCFLWAVIKSI